VRNAFTAIRKDGAGNMSSEVERMIGKENWKIVTDENWLAGLEPEDYTEPEKLVIVEAGEGDFFALDITEKELRKMTGYKGKIMAVRDEYNNYTYSLIKGD